MGHFIYHVFLASAFVLCLVSADPPPDAAATKAPAAGGAKADGAGPKSCAKCAAADCKDEKMACATDKLEDLLKVPAEPLWTAISPDADFNDPTKYALCITLKYPGTNGTFVVRGCAPAKIGEVEVCKHTREKFTTLLADAEGCSTCADKDDCNAGSDAISIIFQQNMLACAMSLVFVKLFL